MALVTRKEFAAICGCSLAIINTNVNRSKIAVLPNKKIDTESQLNKNFKKLRALTKKTRAAKKAPKVIEIEKEVMVYSQPEPKRTSKEEQEINDRADNIVDWQERKIIADAKKAERDSELKALQLEKMMGQLIPVELMRRILKINIQNVFMSFENELINIASIYCDILAGGDRKKLADITKQMRDNLARIIADTNKNAAKEIRGVVTDYSETRSRGERK
jgi:hypothetical protein